mgnify:CR=1 FL=1|tara:strand:- start:44 stop:451 length:408 start_codon:yes stop_codon:yes gene_type:complete
MATLTPTLTLHSSDLSSEVLSLSVSDSLTVTAPSMGISTLSTAVNFGDGAGVLIPEEDTTINYVYIKHTGLAASDGTTPSTNLVTVDGDDADAGMRLVLGAGEFAFFPLIGSEGLKVAHATAAVMIEFAYWSKGA